MQPLCTTLPSSLLFTTPRGAYRICVISAAIVFVISGPTLSKLGVFLSTVGAGRMLGVKKTRFKKNIGLELSKHVVSVLKGFVYKCIIIIHSRRSIVSKRGTFFLTYTYSAT